MSKWNWFWVSCLARDLCAPFVSVVIDLPYAAAAKFPDKYTARSISAADISHALNSAATVTDQNLCV